MLSCYKAKEKRKIKYIRVVTPHAFNRALSRASPSETCGEKGVRKYLEIQETPWCTKRIMSMQRHFPKERDIVYSIRSLTKQVLLKLTSWTLHAEQKRTHLFSERKTVGESRTHLIIVILKITNKILS